MADFNTELANFATAYKRVMTEAMATGSVYDVAMNKLMEQYENMGLSLSEKAKNMAGMAVQMAVNIETTAQATAVALSGAHYKADLLIAQKADVAAATTVKTAQKLLVDRQKTGFDDKKRVDKAKVLGDTVGLTSNATGTLDVGLLASLNTAIAEI